MGPENFVGGQDIVEVGPDNQDDLILKLKKWFKKHKPTRSCAIVLIVI